MATILKQEFKLNLKNLLIWSFIVGGLGYICIMLYSSMGDEMAEMADKFSNMGAFSDAFGMSTLSIATLPGFFATEVGTVHGLGSAMFAAILATCILSKEEDGHTGEFLYSLPVSRGGVVTAKALTVLINLILFTVICGALYILGFVCLGEDILWKEMLIFMGSMLLMNIEIGSICLLISAMSTKNRFAIGLGVALLSYGYDIMGRVLKNLKNYLFIGPYSYANASEIFSGKAAPDFSIIIAATVIIITIAATYYIYTKRDLAS